MIKFQTPDFQTLSEKEWIYTNGIGGYASASLSGANTRRYHGLLVAALNPPTNRMVLVSKVEETVLVDDKAFEIGCSQYQNAINPNGYEYMTGFDRFPFPKTTFQSEAFKIEKTVFMVYKSNTTVLTYKNTGKNELVLRVNVFLNHRDYHGNLHENTHTNFYTESEAQILKTYAFYGAEPLFTKHSGTFVPEPNWYKNFFYAKEHYRGLDPLEDTFKIGYLELKIKPKETTTIIFTTDKAILQEKEASFAQKELKRLKNLGESDDAFLNDLLVSGNQFIVDRKSTDSHSIIAGYHWFTDWGRDSMIAMRGLCIDTRNKESSESILKTFLDYLNEGMLPNRFPDAPDDAVEYNTIDATLWLFVVLYEYYQKFQDKVFIENAFDKLSEIIQYHKTKTRYNIHETPEGFIYGGEGIAQITWMDARIGDYVVTPRHGCPVEIQALWYNALKTYQYFQMECNINSNLIDSVQESIAKLEINFSTFFLNEKGYLNDVVLPTNSADDSLRCNQIYAVSLPFSMLDKNEQKKIVDVVAEKLLTPYGLRTLEIDNADFKPTYGGDVWSRDEAYHQGTVWPFLISEYAAAYQKVYKKNAKATKHIESLLTALQNHFYNEGCIGGISEVFDGESPQQGKGTIQQAWSVAALIRIKYLLKNQ